MSIFEDKIKEFKNIDVKIHFENSISIEIGDTSMDVAANQTISIPRKTANLLVKEGKGTIEYDDLLIELKQTLSKEKMIGEYDLSSIDEFFYLRLKEYYEILTGDDKESFMVLFIELFRMRSGKIIRFASTSLSLLDKLSSKLSFEEADFLRKINESYNELYSKIFPKKEDY